MTRWLLIIVVPLVALASVNCSTPASCSTLSNCCLSIDPGLINECTVTADTDDDKQCQQELTTLQTMGFCITGGTGPKVDASTAKPDVPAHADMAILRNDVGTDMFVGDDIPQGVDRVITTDVNMSPDLNMSFDVAADLAGNLVSTDAALDAGADARPADASTDSGG